MAIEGHDSADLTAGKLVLESGDSLKLSASNSSHIKFIGSILETLNWYKKWLSSLVVEKPI